MKSLTRIAILSAITLAATSPLTLAQSERPPATGTVRGTAQGTVRGTRPDAQAQAKTKQEAVDKKKQESKESTRLTDEERKRQLAAMRRKMEAQKDEAARGKARRAGQTTDARMKVRDLPAEPSVEKRGEHTEKAETQRGGEHDAERSAESKAEHADGAEEHGGQGKARGEHTEKPKANPASGQLVTAIRQNRIRMARMDRLRKVFRERGDNVKVERVQALRTKESEQFQKKLARFKNALGAEQYDRIMKRLSK